VVALDLTKTNKPDGASRVVQTNDSPWRIAENLYGEGQFYHALRQHNNMSERTDLIKPGQTLAVPAYFEIQGSNVVSS
jgi:nucleoid-associated protein YgaU